MNLLFSSLGGTVCLSTSILPDIVLPQSLCNSVGITLLFQGLGSIIGTPVAGMVINKYKCDIFFLRIFEFICQNFVSI